MPRKDQSNPAISAQHQQEQVSEGIENYELPKSIVTRIAKSAIPDNAKLQKEFVLALLKGSTVFINYLAATAHDVAASKQHKSISASDVLKALEIVEFGDLVGPFTKELQAYRENAKNDKQRKVGATASSATYNAVNGINVSSIAAASAASASSKTGGKGKEKSAGTGGPAQSGDKDTHMSDATSAAKDQLEEEEEEEEEIEEEEVEEEDIGDLEEEDVEENEEADVDESEGAEVLTPPQDDEDAEMS